MSSSRFKYLPVFFALVLLNTAQGQRTLAGETAIRVALDRINTLGSVMMIAAHPDDENTALLAYFARGKHFRTAYLSLTRGEGGQNLIGSEQGDQLGIIRTQELLAARRIDGGEQFFTRAIDFGFSKNAVETISKWGREMVQADIVWNIRRFRPDVVILRFSGTSRDGHGHHQTSAIIGKEAFEAAGDPQRFPEQLALGVEPWKARRLLFNTFAFTAEQEREAAATAGRLEVDLGEYSPILGYSYGEIAGMSRSQHRSQGFGSAERKGAMKNYLLHVEGDRAQKDAFDGIDTSWKRIPASGQIGELLAEARRTFDPADPGKILPLLVQARGMIAGLKHPWALLKQSEVEETISLCAGLWLDAVSDRHALVPGGPVKFTLTAVNRSTAPVAIMGARLEGINGAPALSIATTVLAYNQPANYSVNWTVPEDQPYSQPYWLRTPKAGNLYSVGDARLIGLPEDPPVLTARFRMKIAGAEIEFARPVEYRWVDRAIGELSRPLAIVPPVALGFTEHTLLFPEAKPRRVEVALRASRKSAGNVRLEVPEGWRAEPASRTFDLAFDEQSVLDFEVTPPAGETRGNVRAIATVGERAISTGMEVVRYPHIPVQTLFPDSSSRLIRTEIRTTAKRIGYVMGAGDEVPDALHQLGCEVALLGSEDLARGDFSRFDAIVTGVRAFNTRADLRANYLRLHSFVNAGGTLIVQYNTQEGGGFMGGDPALLEHVGPLPVRIGRDRVTVEEAPVAFPHPDHPLLQAPNRITSRDFEGWVQERGLYFASEWDAKYQTVLESHDPGESPLEGGMLYLRMGKGVYIYTAYSWFRQLPAGVPGAYRIFANMLSAAKTVGP
jgi:LmbE family N-acetylglucosaminyl deacetylase